MTVGPAAEANSKDWPDSPTTPISLSRFTRRLIALIVATPDRNDEEVPRVIVERTILVRAFKLMDEECQPGSPDDIPSTQVEIAIAVANLSAFE